MDEDKFSKIQKKERLLLAAQNEPERVFANDADALWYGFMVRQAECQALIQLGLMEEEKDLSYLYTGPTFELKPDIHLEGELLEMYNRPGDPPVTFH